NSPTSATLNLNIDAAAVAGPRELKFLNPGPVVGSDIITAPGGFTVNAGGLITTTAISLIPVTTFIPAIAQAAPNTGMQGSKNLNVTLTGKLTHFVQGTTTADFGPGITVASLKVDSATSASATLNIDPAATGGARTITVKTGGETASLAN